MGPGIGRVGQECWRENRICLERVVSCELSLEVLSGTAQGAACGGPFV
jgi:hypothetical protein